VSAPELPAAVLWDLDGTLVDTEPTWLAVELALANRHGATWTEQDGLALVGADLLTSGRYIKQRMGLRQTPEQIVEEMLDDMVVRMEQGVEFCPGVLPLLEELRSLDVPCALVTMTYLRMVEPILKQLPSGTFGAVVTGDRVAQGKPHPEAYLTAAAQLGVEPPDCIAIEDSVRGAASAEAAGARVVAVPNRVDVPAKPGRVVVPTLSDMTLSSLLRLASAAADDDPANVIGR